MQRIQKTFAAVTLSLCSAFAGAQDYPAKPVSLIIPFSPGGTNDIVGRLVAKDMTASLKQSVVPENRPGASGTIGANYVAKAPADGYTLLVTDLSFAMAPGLYAHLPFDPVKDFSHITTVASVPFVMVVNPSVKANSVKEFIALSKAFPGSINYGSAGRGTNSHLGGELFRLKTGADLTHIPYKGASAAMQDLLGGRIQVIFTALPTALNFIQSGKVKALMVTGDKRVPVLPNVPTAKEAGVADMNLKFWVGIAAPAHTPPAVVEKLSKAVVSGLSQPEDKKTFGDIGMDVIGDKPGQAAKFVETEVTNWRQVMKAANITAE
ncbi:tripartite tricarboxylate transporter substrate binding protein (plasmid) [Cupriavidus pinatubonensis]|uniref:Bug family tripartite tricarboxylate transporter substrate binding protein n=1 Tax=Cupriavidus pinatubonensis TaxID=248026 RepID=UPI001C72B72E|nr:tripartite tricarboxylate transporter substrate binding protein [Cupriavidus pinatubonensis]QYY33867.1 tripartite tricarboxylate transporter substrate binding protein [Cupriavidus pinatubonensis]